MPTTWACSTPNASSTSSASTARSRIAYGRSSNAHVERPVSRWSYAITRCCAASRSTRSAGQTTPEALAPMTSSSGVASCDPTSHVHTRSPFPTSTNCSTSAVSTPDARWRGDGSARRRSPQRRFSPETISAAATRRSDARSPTRDRTGRRSDPGASRARHRRLTPRGPGVDGSCHQCIRLVRDEQRSARRAAGDEWVETCPAGVRDPEAGVPDVQLGDHLIVVADLVEHRGTERAGVEGDRAAGSPTHSSGSMLVTRRASHVPRARRSRTSPASAGEWCSGSGPGLVGGGGIRPRA